MSATDNVLISLLGISFLQSEKKGEKQITREDYGLVWNTNNAIAIGVFQAFNFLFPDLQKRYLRAVSLRNNPTICLVQLTLREKTGTPYIRDVHLEVAYTQSWVPANTTTVFTWNGDIPFKGEIRVHAYDCEVDDELACVILYEEKQ